MQNTPLVVKKGLEHMAIAFRSLVMIQVGDDSVTVTKKKTYNMNVRHYDRDIIIITA